MANQVELSNQRTSRRREKRANDMPEEKTIEGILKSTPTIKTSTLAEILGRTARTLYRWQDESMWQNPMPSPFSSARGVRNVYNSGKILEWFKTLPMRKKTLAK